MKLIVLFFAVLSMMNPHTILGQNLKVDKDHLRLLKQVNEGVGGTTYGDWFHHSNPQTDLILTGNRRRDRSYDGDPVLMFVCPKDGQRGTISYGSGPVLKGDYLGRVELAWHFRNGPSREGDILFLGPDSKTVSLPFDPWVVREARSASHLVLHSTDPADGTTVTNIFSLNGFSDAFDQLPCAGQL